MTTVICPCCGSSSLSPRDVINDIILNGCAIHIPTSEWTCNECHESGDFGMTSDVKIDNALQEFRNKTAIDILDKTNKLGPGFNDTNIDLLLNIPIGTCLRWRAFGIDQVGFALLVAFNRHPEDYFI
jgi:hypothetical protein